MSSLVCINEQSDTPSRDAFAQIDASREGVSLCYENHPYGRMNRSMSVIIEESTDSH